MCQYDLLFDGQQQSAPFPSMRGGVDREFAQTQGCDAAAALPEDAVGVGAVAVEAALSQADADKDDGEREFVADVFELVADLHAGGALFEEVQFVDARDLGEAAARLLLAPHNREHDGYMHHVTGSERIRFSEVAELLTELLGVTIAYEDDPHAFTKDVEHVVNSHFGPGATEYFLAFSENEQKEEPLFVVTDVLRHLLGREPRTLREWIKEHRHIFLAEGSPLLEPR